MKATVPGLVDAKFIGETREDERGSFDRCHASTIVETDAGLVAAWFGGLHEGHEDVGVWVTCHRESRWQASVQVATGVEPDGSRHPCWNPVLVQPRNGPLLLFYKCGPRPSLWWGLLMRSIDCGRSWSAPERLPDGILGPIKNKAVELGDGTLLCPSSSEHDGWRVHFEWTRDCGLTWARSASIGDGRRFACIQPALLQHADGRLQALCRSKRRRITETWSADRGRTWSPMATTELPNPNAGADALTLADGRHLLVYNHTTEGRSPLNIALSRDGVTWGTPLALEAQRGEYSYPAVIQSRDGRVHVVYTWKRLSVRHLTLDPSRL